MDEAGLLEMPFGRDGGGAELEYPTFASMVRLEDVACSFCGVAAALIDVQSIPSGHAPQNAMHGSIFEQRIFGQITRPFAPVTPGADADPNVVAPQTERAPVDGGHRLTGANAL